jgi:hypothetical protein
MGNDKSFGSAFREIFARKKSEANRVEPAESVDFVAELISPHAPIEVAPASHEEGAVAPQDVAGFPTLLSSVETVTNDEPVHTASLSWRDRLPRRSKKKREDSLDFAETSAVWTQRPIRLFMGYVPDVTEKDARFFAMGVAEKNVESEYISYLGVFRYGTGYAYEIQEGGHGHSYLTKIIKHFNQLPPNLHDAETAVFVATASRMVQIEKTADGGLVCIQLPELYKVQETDWVTPEKKLKLLRDQNSGIMMVAGTYLGISLLVLAGAFLTRYVPRENPTGRVWYDTVSMKELPISQWGSMIQETNNNHYILSLRYNGKEWCRKTEVTETCGDKQVTVHPGTNPGQPATVSPASTPGASTAASGANAASAISIASAASAASATSTAAPAAAPAPAIHPLPPLPPMPNK